jgi:hypothetical protein
MSITAVIYLSVYFFGLIYALFKKPIFGIYIYYFALYMYAPGQWWGEPLPELRWSLIAGIVTLLATFLKRRVDNEFFKLPEHRFLLLFLLFLILQLVWAMNIELQFEYTILVLKFIIIIFLLHSTVKTERDLINIILVNLIGCAYWGWIGFTSNVSGRFENVGTPGMDDGNLLSIHVAPVLFMSSFLLLCDIGKKKYILIPFLVLVINLVFLTQSRGAIVGIVVAGLFSFFIVPRKVFKQYKRYIVLVLLGGSLIVGPSLINRISDTLSESDDGAIEKSAGSRIVIVKAQIEMMKENYFFGQGHLSTLMLSPFYIDEAYLTTSGSSSGAALRGSHNLVMALFVDHGFLGGGLYLIVLYYSYRKVSANKADEKNGYELGNLHIILSGLVISLICFFVASQSANSKKLEIDILIIGLIGITYKLISELRSKK